jgi:DNA polymerase-3 subunit delta'
MNDAWSVGLVPWLEPAFRQLDAARQSGHLSHAWLLAGPRGIGKLNLASCIARRLLDSSSGLPGVLDAAGATAALQSRHEEHDRAPDLHIVVPPVDKRSIAVEQVRDAIAALALTSHGGVGKILIIAPAEAMTLAASNALLKTLEEPTDQTYFFLVSHQPGFLPATVRSRCQTLALQAPAAEVGAAWLQPALAPMLADAGELRGLLALTGGAPLRALELQLAEKININKELSDIFESIYRKKLDPQQVADSWVKSDPALLLEWLVVRLEASIKRRLAPEAWTSVTDPGDDRLHNAWGGLTLRTLFERHRDARQLLDDLGGGVNLELALRVLLLGFQPGSRES